jgi:hypothetical protein
VSDNEYTSGHFLVAMAVAASIGTGAWLFFGSSAPHVCRDVVISQGICASDQVLDVTNGVALCRCKR